MTFWILVALATALAVIYIWCASAYQLGAGVSASQSASELYQARLSEIEKDRDAGKIDDVSAKDAAIEEGRRLLNSQQHVSKLSSPRLSAIGLIFSMVMVPVVAISIYLQFGNPQFLFMPESAEPTAEESSINELVALAEERLKTRPDDSQGWKVLAPIYNRMGRYSDAEKAHREIVRIDGPSAQNLAALGESITRNRNGEVTLEAKLAFEQSLKLDQANPIAQFMLGVFAAQNGKPEEAVERWQSMVDGGSGTEAWYDEVKKRIAEISSSIASPSSDDAETIRNLPKDQQQDAIKGMVDGLAEKLESDPSDKRGWLQLVRAYLVLGETGKAKAAADRAIEEHKNDVKFIEAIKTQLGLVKSEEDQ